MEKGVKKWERQYNYIKMKKKYKKHDFARNEEAEVSECQECGYVWGQEHKRGCGEEWKTK